MARQRAIDKQMMPCSLRRSVIQWQEKRGDCEGRESAVLHRRSHEHRNYPQPLEFTDELHTISALPCQLAGRAATGTGSQGYM